MFTLIVLGLGVLAGWVALPQPPEAKAYLDKLFTKKDAA